MESGRSTGVKDPAAEIAFADVQTELRMKKILNFISE